MAELSEIFRSLAEPFSPADVRWRVGPRTKDKTRGIPLAYIDARHVSNRLDEVVGPANWRQEYRDANHDVVICKLWLCPDIDEPWAWKEDGAQYDSESIEPGKAAISEAFKRAASMWGIGRYLYGVHADWIELDQWGRIPEKEMPRLRKLLEGETPPPAPQKKVDKVTATIRKAQQTSTVEELLLIDGNAWRACEDKAISLEQFAQIAFAIEARLRSLEDRDALWKYAAAQKERGVYKP